MEQSEHTNTTSGNNQIKHVERDWFNLREPKLTKIGVLWLFHMTIVYYSF
jgi:hypothetical protein